MMVQQKSSDWWRIDMGKNKEYSPDSNNPFKTKLQAWLMMYGSEAMILFFANTNKELIWRKYLPMNSYSKVIKFQGIMWLCTRFEFSDHREKNNCKTGYYQ